MHQNKVYWRQWKATGQYVKLIRDESVMRRRSVYRLYSIDYFELKANELEQNECEPLFTRENTIINIGEKWREDNANHD